MILKRMGFEEKREKFYREKKQGSEHASHERGIVRIQTTKMRKRIP